MIHWQIGPPSYVPTAATRPHSSVVLEMAGIKNPVLPSPVITHVEGIKALGEALHIGGADSLQEVDVVLRVKAAHVMLGGLVRLEDLGMET